MIDTRFYILLAHLWRGGKYGLYWTNDDGNGAKYTYWVAVDPHNAPIVPKLFYDRDAYFGIHPSRIRRSEFERARVKDGDIAAINCLYNEIDCADDAEKFAQLEAIKQWTHRPTVIIDSGGGLHCYYLLCETFHLDTEAKTNRAIDLQWAFVQWNKGDPQVNDLSRVLRIPGTFNHKAHFTPDFPEVKIREWELTRQYKIEDFETLLQPLIDERNSAKAHTPHTSSTVSLNVSDDRLLKVLFSSKNGAKYERLSRGDYSDVNGDPSVGDQLFCDGLAWVTSRDVARMDSLFRQTALMRDKWLRDDYRIATLENAANSAQMDYDPFSGFDPEALKAAEDLVMNGTPPPITPPHPPSGNSMPIDKQLMTFGANDEGNAQSVYLLFGQQFLYCDAYGYLRYNGRFWESDGAEAALDRAIIATLQQRCVLAIMNNQDAILKASKPNAGNVKSCLYLFRSLIAASVETFDADPESLNCNNGVVNLKTGALMAHNPSQRYTYCVTVDYDPTADYVEWVEFLTMVTPKPEVVDYLHLAVGYTATGLTQEECLFYIHGPSRSGKGTFVETLLSVLPKPLGVQADFSTFTAKREGDMQNFDLAPLKPARFVAASESSKYDTLNEAKIKTATGGDWIRCAFKHRDHFEYRPQFKIWLVSNHPIKGDVDDDAFWGRVKVIEFPHSFLGKEDKTLKRRMKSPAILREVLRWMVDGAMAWFASSTGLNAPQAVIDATAARRNDLDFIQQWLDECCKPDPTAWTANSDVRTSYEHWCKAEGQTPKGPEHFARALSKKGYNVGVRGRTPLGKQVRGIQGLSII